MELAREQLDKIRTIMKEDNLESIIDRLFCELNGLVSLGSTDEGHLNYSLNEYWLFGLWWNSQEIKENDTIIQEKRSGFYSYLDNC